MAMEARKRAMHLGALGSVSLRVVLALSASTGLTAAVALPMAYQAHEARAQANEPRPKPPTAVLGTSSVPDGSSSAVSDGLHWSPTASALPAPLLDGATLSGPVHIFVPGPSVVRIDIRLDDEPVRSDFDEPFELRDGQPLDADSLTDGPHTVTATVSFEDGRTELRQANFSVAAG